MAEQPEAHGVGESRDELEALEQEARAGDADAMFDLATSCEVTGDLSGARLWLESAAAQGHVSALLKIGFQAQSAGHLDAAEEEYERVVSGDDDWAEHVARFRLAVLAWRRGDPARANVLLREAAYVDDPDDERLLALVCQWFESPDQSDEAAASNAIAWIARYLGDEDTEVQWLRNAVRLGDDEALLELIDSLDECDEKSRLREAMWSRSLVCADCLNYALGTSCRTCGSDQLVDQGELSPTEHIALWINSEGQGAEMLSRFILDKCDWDKVHIDDLGAVANWRTFVAYLHDTDWYDKAIRDGANLEDARLDTQVLSQRVYDWADFIRSIE